MKTRTLKQNTSQSSFETLTEKEMNSVKGGGTMVIKKEDDGSIRIILSVE